MEPTTHVHRIIDDKLQRYLTGLPAVSIEGVKGAGKTTLAKKYAQTEFRMDSESVATLVLGTPTLLRDAKKPVLIDEWQVTPSIWNEVRHFVDEDMSPGRFILTGSALPKSARIHSGSGRIVRMRMRPFSLAERGLAPVLITLEDLVNNCVDISPQQIDVPQQAYVRELLQSGLPGVRKVDEAVQKDLLNGYIDNIVEKEFAEQGTHVRRPEALRAWLKAYAAAEATTTSYESIMNAATPGQDKKPSKPTTMVYRETLQSLWVLDPVLPWLPEGNLFTNVAKAPKHYLVDPALTACLLDVDENRLLAGEAVRLLGNQTKTLVGRLFEGLIAQSLKVYTDALRLDLRHFRTKRGDHEVDFIIEKGSTLVAIEAKFSTSVGDDDVKHLNWLEHTFPDRDVVKVIIYTGNYLVQRESDGVIAIPAACLGCFLKRYQEKQNHLLSP